MNTVQIMTRITETVDELKTIMHAQSKAKLKERVHALYLLKAGTVNDISGLAYFLGRSESTVRLWLSHYLVKGLCGLLAWNYHGGKRPALSKEILEALQLRLQEPEGFQSYGEIKDGLSSEYDLEIPYKTVHQTVHYKLKAKLKVARPQSRYRQEEAVVDFKKTARSS